jgi:hypothetical protein
LFELEKYLKQKGGLIKSVKEKWTTLTKLHKDKNPLWSEFIRLLDFRNAIIHAGVSLPQSNVKSEWREKFVSQKDLDELKSGWAVNVVYRLALHLHHSTGVSVPNWLIDHRGKTPR